MRRVDRPGIFWTYFKECELYIWCRIYVLQNILDQSRISDMIISFIGIGIVTGTGRWGTNPAWDQHQSIYKRTIQDNKFWCIGQEEYFESKVSQLESVPDTYPEFFVESQLVSARRTTRNAVERPRIDMLEFISKPKVRLLSWCLTL